jgi:hypothetical protein
VAQQMDQDTEILLRLAREQVRTSRDMLAHLHGEIVEAEKLIAHSKVAVAESLSLLGKSH